MLLTWLLTWSELLTSPPPEVSNSQALSNYVSNQPSFLAVWPHPSKRRKY